MSALPTVFVVWFGHELRICRRRSSAVAYTVFRTATGGGFFEVASFSAGTVGIIHGLSSVRSPTPAVFPGMRDVLPRFFFRPHNRESGKMFSWD